MSSPTYLELRLLLPLDVYNATLTFIGERMRDIKHTTQAIDTKTLSSYKKPSPPPIKPDSVPVKFNLRKAVETSCSCCECFDWFCRDDTTPWYISKDKEEVVNVRDGDAIKTKDLCEGVKEEIFDYYEKTKDSSIGFICLSRIERDNEKTRNMMDLAEKKLQASERIAENGKEDLKFRKMKFNNNKAIQETTLALASQKLAKKKVENVESRLIKKSAQIVDKLPKDTVNSIKAQFIEFVNSGECIDSYAGEPPRVKFVWARYNGEEFEISCEKIYQDRIPTKGKFKLTAIEQWPSGKLKFSGLPGWIYGN